jgi:hypothetical protein
MEAHVRAALGARRVRHEQHRPLSTNLLDVELVEVLDLGAREEELYTDDGGVLPEWGWCPLAGGSRGSTGEATRQGCATSKPRNVGQRIAGL